MTENSESFKNYMRNHKHAMLNFARKLTRDNFEAEEIVQVATIKAFRGWHTFKRGTNFKSWIFTIIKNTFVTKYNKRKRRNTINLPHEKLQYATDKRFSGSNKAISNLTYNEIQKSIQCLSYKFRIPFEMFVEGFQYDEIADKLNIPMGTVKSRINTARSRMKKRMIEAGLRAA